MNILMLLLITYLTIGAVLASLLFMLATKSRSNQPASVLIATWISITLGWAIVVPWMIKEVKKGN